ncbi:DUF1080 domain-containing protein [Verrucomicrobia bacterium]|jgi:hypothetical protein|nr:DUF1080 domain-containing protein [Verrucomicrobiota bacterium]MDA7671040.1 DUF1080 domain-containing protein [Verrucomicrobiota bacterium]MDB4691587.1 DUF1080 domain-containing protein [Verrucomicrobiota bacterium]
MKSKIILSLFFASTLLSWGQGWVSLFDGKSFTGWEGNYHYFRIENNAIVGGMTYADIPRNQFLSTADTYQDFELQLQFRLVGKQTNAGVQIRTRRIPDHHEVIGYQADLGQDYTGCLYDESRRRKILAEPDREALAKVLKPGEWNDYVIRCEGKRIQLWINGYQTVDYTETDRSIEQDGILALQIHGGPAGEAWYRNIKIKKLL